MKAKHSKLSSTFDCIKGAICVPFRNREMCCQIDVLFSYENCCLVGKKIRTKLTANAIYIRIRMFYFTGIGNSKLMFFALSKLIRILSIRIVLDNWVHGLNAF